MAYPPTPIATPPVFEYDPNNKTTAAFLGADQIPTPSEMEERTIIRSASFELPNGDVVTQVRWRGRVFTWQWDGLNQKDQLFLRSKIDAAGMDMKQLYIPTLIKYMTEAGTQEPDHACVRPDGEDVYDATIRWNPEAGNTRWLVTMVWREVPGACLP